MQHAQYGYLLLMHRYVRVVRPVRDFSKKSRGPRFTIRPRPVRREDAFARTERGSVNEPSHALPSAPFQIDPYLDYGRFLTAEGGILIIYKDIDTRWRHTMWRLFAWMIFTGIEANYLFNPAPIQNQWLAIGLLLAAAIINWLIVIKPVELYRRVEIRPDCMIIDGSDVFKVRFFERMLSFQSDAKGNQIFCGTYGTRFIEFLTIRRFDNNDRMPEIMSDHLQDAMRQLWMVPY
jgi:hypothetical protein